MSCNHYVPMQVEEAGRMQVGVQCMWQAIFISHLKVLLYGFSIYLQVIFPDEHDTTVYLEPSAIVPDISDT